MLSFSPSCERVGNSFSPISAAIPPVAATLPAAKDARLVVSRFPTSPSEAISWPSLSTKNTTFAEASMRSRARTAFIWWYCCSRNRIGVSAIVRLVVRRPGRDATWRVKAETPRRKGQTHFSIANNGHQDFSLLLPGEKAGLIKGLKHLQLLVSVDLNQPSVVSSPAIPRLLT